MCNAVGYAHSRGVIHRDLKPANAMLGEYGETLVVDWGLARFLDRPNGEQSSVAQPLTPSSRSGSSATEIGQAVGTPAFMPPEQAAGQLDQVGIASDVFALGATLYCLLTGQAPYGGTGALRNAIMAESVPARQRKRSVPAALEAVCGKAMADQPEDRYGSARDLAQEVQRWLADEPVDAYREPMSQRLRRWGRRNRSVVSAGVMLLLASVIGLSVGLWAVQREQARTAAALTQVQENLHRAEKAETEANGNLKLARQAIDETFNVAKEHPLFQMPRMEKAKKLLLEMTLPFYKQFREQRPEDPGLQREEAKQWGRVAFIEHFLGQGREALLAYQQARDIFVALTKAHPEVSRYQDDLASTYSKLANCLAEIGKRDEALEQYQLAREVQERLVKAHPNVAEYQNTLALIDSNLGMLLAGFGKREEALGYYRKALDAQVRLAKEHPKERQYRQYLAGVHDNLGLLLVELGKREEALEEHRQAHDIHVKLARAHPELPHYQNALGNTHRNLGVLLAELGKSEEALKEYEKGAMSRPGWRRLIPMYQGISTTWPVRSTTWA